MSPKTSREKPGLMVTGANGALARLAIERLRERFSIIAVDFRRRVNLGPMIPSFQLDFNKRGFEDIFREHSIEAVLHLGRMELNVADGYSRFNANVVGTQRLLDLCVTYGVSNVAVLSSFHVYGAHLYNPALFDEKAPLKASELSHTLTDVVEMDGLVRIYLYQYPQLNIKLLRPCHIVGPGMRNSTSRLLSSRLSPALMGFSPVIQLIHCHDMAKALELAIRKNERGIYNVAPRDWVGLQEAMIRCGVRRLFLPSIPPPVPLIFSKLLRTPSFPSYLVNFFKYPVTIDPGLFEKTFDFEAEYNLQDIFDYYTSLKRRGSKEDFSLFAA